MNVKNIEYVLLEPGYLPVRQINLKQKEYFTQKSLKHIIDQAMEANRSYYFSVAKFEHEWQVLDAVEYCKYLEATDDDDTGENAVSGLGTIKDAEFYQIDSSDSWEELEDSFISHFCSIQQLDGYCLHKIRLSDSEIDLKTQYGFEYQLALDYEFGRGVAENPQRSLDLIKYFSLEGNYFCQVQLSYYSFYGLNNVEQDLFCSSYWFFEAARSCDDLNQYLQPNVLQQFGNLPLLKQA